MQKTKIYSCRCLRDWLQEQKPNVKRFFEGNDYRNKNRMSKDPIQLKHEPILHQKQNLPVHHTRVNFSLDRLPSIQMLLEVTV